MKEKVIKDAAELFEQIKMGRQIAPGVYIVEEPIVLGDWEVVRMDSSLMPTLLPGDPPKDV